jgi:biopolymer transport protein ExbD
MKKTGHIALLLLLTGCTTIRKPALVTFDDAVRASIEARGDGQVVVIVMEKEGTMSVGGRQITLDDIPAIRNVSGLPSNPPGILIRADPEALHKDVKACLDALSKAGIWRIAFWGVETDDLHNKGLLRTGAPQTESPHR